MCFMPSFLIKHLQSHFLKTVLFTSRFTCRSVVMCETNGRNVCQITSKTDMHQHFCKLHSQEYIFSISALTVIIDCCEPEKLACLKESRHYDNQISGPVVTSIMN